VVSAEKVVPIMDGRAHIGARIKELRDKLLTQQELADQAQVSDLAPVSRARRLADVGFDDLVEEIVGRAEALPAGVPATCSGSVGVGPFCA
jgi:transcriptional regulator with XRE-family HTH domain